LRRAQLLAQLEKRPSVSKNCNPRGVASAVVSVIL
jgi:hypothetical protein